MLRSALVSALALTLCLVTGCKESGYEYLDKGLALLGEAERGDCDLGMDRNTGQPIINTRRVSDCLEKTKAALVELHKAQQLGIDTNELNNLVAKTELEVSKLESMLRMVSRMEHERGR